MQGNRFLLLWGTFATDVGMRLQARLEEQTKEAARDSDDAVQIRIVPQTGIGDEACSAVLSWRKSSSAMWCAARAGFGHGAHPSGCAQVGEEQIR